MLNGSNLKSRPGECAPLFMTLLPLINMHVSGHHKMTCEQCCSLFVEKHSPISSGKIFSYKLYRTHLGPPLISATALIILASHDVALAQFRTHWTFNCHWIGSQKKFYNIFFLGKKKYMQSSCHKIL